MTEYTKGVYRLSGAELGLVKPLIQEFRDELDLPFSFEVFEPKQKLLMESASSFILVSMEGEEAVGMIAFQIQEDLLSELTWAVEQAWWVKPDFRGTSRALRLFKAYEKFAKEQGADRITMVHINAMRGDTLKKFYEKQGFTDLETQYVKEI